MRSDSATEASWYRSVIWFTAFLLGPWQVGCALGPRILHHNQREYNESVKCTDEEELLLNLVRLRYNDDIGLLNTNSITAQYEAQAQVNAVPFFGVGGVNFNRTFSEIMPSALVSAAGRPTFSLAPVMDSGVYRRLFKPVDNAELFKLAELSWPTSTIFRLWFQYANGVPNAVTASGPTRECPPEFEDYQAGMKLLEVLIDRGLCTISTEDRVIELGSPLPANSMTPAALLDAVRTGYEYQQKKGEIWVLTQTRKHLVLKFSPEALAEPEVCQFREIFHLKHDALSYPLNLVGPEPRAVDGTPPEMAAFNLVPRSGIQLYFYLAHGIDVPDKHLGCGLAKATVGPDGECFDWRQVTQGLFAVHHSKQHCRPKNAHVAVKYHDHWFYIANDDAASKSTFALVLLMARIEFGLTAGSPAPAGPALTLPVGR